MIVQHWFLRAIRLVGVALVAVVVLGQGVGLALAQHNDVRPKNVSGQIVTDGYDDGTGITTPDVRVFGYDFGEDPADPFFAQDPGFNAVVGSGLQAGAFSFDVLGPGSALPYNLSYWNGAGSVHWSAAPNSERLRWNRGSHNVYVDSGGTGLIGGFSIGNVAGSGSLHVHLNAFLEGSDGNSVPAGPGAWGAGDGVEATPGIYALAVVFKNGSLANSNPIWIVYNNGFDEETHDVAIEWLNQHAVPEPATWLLAGIGGAVLVGARGRSRRLALKAA